MYLDWKDKIKNNVSTMSKRVKSTTKSVKKLHFAKPRQTNQLHWQITNQITACI
jgi:hypothetical protein